MLHDYLLPEELLAGGFDLFWSRTNSYWNEQNKNVILAKDDAAYHYTILRLKYCNRTNTVFREYVPVLSERHPPIPEHLEMSLFHQYSGNPSDPDGAFQLYWERTHVYWLAPYGPKSSQANYKRNKEYAKERARAHFFKVI